MIKWYKLEEIKPDAGAGVVMNYGDFFFIANFKHEDHGDNTVMGLQAEQENLSIKIQMKRPKKGITWAYAKDFNFPKEK